MTREEAIEKLRHMSLPKETMGILEALAPELAESEDERIRKLLVWQVYRNIEDETNDLKQSIYNGVKGHDPDLEESIEDWKKCLAWLEEQKDMNCLACDQHLKGYLAGRKVTEEEKQKPLQSETEREYVRTLKSLISDFLRGKDEVDREYYQQIYDWLDGRHIEQKPVEIKIDNPNIQKFDPDVELTTSDSSADGKELLYVSNKSYDIGFRDGVNSVKPAEWSEVELEFRGEKVKVKRPFFRDDKGRGYSTTEQDDEVTWNALRAWTESHGYTPFELYPRAEWKPSEEQEEPEYYQHFDPDC